MKGAGRRVALRWSAASVALAGLGLVWAGEMPLIRRLSAHSVLQAELAGGETHRYEVELTAGDYLEVVFDQHGIDIIPVVLGPDGARLFRNDTGEWGREEVAIVAPMSGVYRLDAEPARSTFPRGGYELRVEALRPATPGDEARAHVTGLLSQAYAAMSPVGTATGSILKGDKLQARALYQQALAEWRGLHDRPGEAFALTALSFIANNMDDFRTQLEYARQAAPIWGEVGNAYAEGRSLRAIGQALRILGEDAEAISAFKRSLAIQRAVGNLHFQARLLDDLAISHGAAGELGAALAYAYESVALARRLGDAMLEARMMATVARIHLDLGEFQICVDACRRLLELSILDEVTRARITGVMGTALVRLGDRVAARQALEESLAYWTKIGWRSFQAGGLIALGDLHVQDGDLDRARGVFELAATHAGASGLAWAEATSRRRLAETLIRLGRLSEAERAMRTVADLSRGEPNTNARAFDRVLAAKLALARNDLASARRHAEAALGLSESARARAASDRVRSAMLASSQVVYETLVDVLMAQHALHPAAAYEARALEVSERARARSLLELMLAGSFGTVRGSVGDLLDQMRSIQRRLNAKAQALDAAHAAKSASRIASLTHDIDELADEYTVLDGRMRHEQSRGTTIASPNPLTLPSIQADVLDKQTLLVEFFLSDPASYAFVVSKDSIESHRLASRKLIEEAAAAFQKGVSEPPATSPERRASHEADKADLGELLLGPLRSIKPGTRLLIVAPGMLQQIPFAALQWPGSAQLMVDRHEIVQAPSASVVAAGRKTSSARPPPARAVAVFADPVYEPTDPRVNRARSLPPGEQETLAAQTSPLGRAVRSLPRGGERSGLSRLPFSRHEAEVIAALAPPGSVRVATGFDATLARVTDPSLLDYRIVHFATHGFLDARTPELSGLVFSLVDDTGSPQEGYLRLHDLGRLYLNADLAVLSGCETALGRDIGGEGVIGLTRGFLLAGARGVVASLWKVDDLATADLMERFYRGMLVQRLPAPAALRDAQRQMAASERWSDRYYWAGFVIQGEWR